MFHQNACRHQTNKCQVQKIWECLHASLPLCLNCFYSCLLSSALKELAMRWIDISTASVLWPEYQHACGNFKMLKIPELSFTLMICTRKKIYHRTWRKLLLHEWRQTGLFTAMRLLNSRTFCAFQVWKALQRKKRDTPRKNLKNWLNTWLYHQADRATLF